MAAAPHGRGFQLRRPHFFFKSWVDLTRPSPSMREGVSPDVDRWRNAPPRPVGLWESGRSRNLDSLVRSSVAWAAQA
jgi:hypothetical protein